MSETKYINGLKKGDIRIFEDIYRKFYPLLYNYAYSIIKERDSAEDVVSETFLKLWEGRDTITITTSLQAYLFKSIYHQCLNVLKHLQVEERYQQMFLHHIPLHEDNSDYPLSGLLENEITNILQNAVEKLPGQCRRIFIMSRFEALKHEEIAQQLDISVNTVRTQIKRALEKLRIELSDFLSILF